jgi:hypothetical protein
MIFQVDYLLKNEEGFKAEGRTLPVLVICDDFDSALKTARKFESANATLFEVKPHTPHNGIVIARGYKGLATEKESA